MSNERPLPRIPRTPPDVADLTSRYREELGHDLALAHTLLRHPAGRRAGLMGHHDVVLPDAPALVARLRTRAAPLPRALVDRLARRDPALAAVDGAPVLAHELGVTIRPRRLGPAPAPAHAGIRSAALVAAMLPPGAAEVVHDRGADARGRVFCWLATREGTVLPSPAALFATPGRAA